MIIFNTSNIAYIRIVRNLFLSFLYFLIDKKIINIYKLFLKLRERFVYMCAYLYVSFIISICFKNIKK